MEDSEEMAWTPLVQPPVPRRRGRRWLLIGGLVIAFMFALAAGAFFASSNGAAQAAALTTGSASSSQALAFTQGNANSAQPLVVAQGQGMPGAGGQGQCETLTVSSVNGSTIVAKSSSGSTVTIHTTASTTYRQAGKTVTASALKAGVQIHVMGTHNSDGSITATSIDIG
jgi:Domain of unknown function (DUF5666)